jgi:cytochrome P450
MAVKENCANLDAVFRECLRVGSENFSVRLVKADTILADKYFLRKDSVVQIAAGVIHSDADIWGEDVDRFNHQRFLRQQQQGSKEQPKTHPAAFRAFGGGKTLCPGRLFASNEILMFAAAMIIAFDLEAPGGGLVSVPEKDDAVMPVHILEPLTKHPVRVVVKTRSEAEAVGRWIVDL